MADALSPFDLHSHTLYSKDGMMKPSSLFKWMARRGLTGVAVTEHERPSFTKPVHIHGRFIINACEFKTSDYGELIGLFVSEAVPSSSFEHTAEKIHEQSGITVLPHPRDPVRRYAALRRGLPDALISKHVDLVEGINSRCVLPIFNTWAQELASKLNKPMTAGSDSHSFLELGHAKTWLRDIESPSDIYEELAAGRTRITGHISFPLWQLPTNVWQRVRRLAR